MSEKLPAVVGALTLLFFSTAAHAQTPPVDRSLVISGAEVQNDGTIRLEYLSDGNSQRVDLPPSLVAEIVSQMRRAASPPEVVSGAATPDRPLPTKRKRAPAVAQSPMTGLSYYSEIIVDSVVTVRYQDAGIDHVAVLPVDLLETLIRHNRSLSGRVAEETQMYVEPGTGTFWITLSRGFNYKAVVFVLSLLLAALVFAVVQVSTRRIRRERDELRSSRRRMLRIREAERTHLASELHDGPVQDVQRILRSNLSSIARVIPMSDSDDLTELESTLRHVAGSLRDICSNLRPPVLAHFGLEKAVESCARAFQLRNPGIAIHERLSLGTDDLSEESRLVVYRILQEALTNIEKHAHARNVRIELTIRDSEVRLCVEDDGRGFRFTPRYSKLEERGHYGLSGMRQRVDSVGGLLYVDSSPGKGTRVTVLVPALSDQALDLSPVDRLI